MSHQKLLTKLEGFRSRNSINHCYINKDVYRLLYDRDFYYIAYNSIKSNDGAETAGSDGTSLHGFCEEWIDDLISSFRDESYQPQPSRITYIPKKNGKMRKLSFPNGKDKLVQECIRIILECIYEPTFSNLSHGFRPNRSVHSALAQVETWRSTVWFIEGDISACFDEIDHRILESILRERIDDERFIRLINKLLNGSFKRDKTFFPQWLSKIKQDVEYRYRDTNPLKRNCYICGNPQHHVRFHRKKISLLRMPYSNIIKEMIRINRRQICLCRECFIRVSQNLLEFNQITKRKLT